MVKERRSERSTLPDRVAKLEADVSTLVSGQQQQTAILERLQESIANLQGERQQDAGSRSSSGAIAPSQGLPQASNRSQTEKKIYELVIEGVVGEKNDNDGSYFVVKRAPITVTVTINKADGTPVEDDDPLASATVKLVVIDEETCASWDNTKFVESMGKKQKAGMQVENGIFELTKGRGVHDKARITKNSTKHEVKLGVMMHACKRDIGETRVIEGVSNLFRVKDRTENTQNKRKKTEGTAQHQNSGQNLDGSFPMETDSEFSVDEYLDNNEKLKSLVTHILSKSLYRVLEEFRVTIENNDIQVILRTLRTNLEDMKQTLIATAGTVLQPQLQNLQSYLNEIKSSHHARIMEYVGGKQFLMDLDRLLHLLTQLTTAVQAQTGADRHDPLGLPLTWRNNYGELLDFCCYHLANCYMDGGALHRYYRLANCYMDGGALHPLYTKRMTSPLFRQLEQKRLQQIFKQHDEGTSCPHADRQGALIPWETMGDLGMSNQSRLDYCMRMLAAMVGALDISRQATHKKIGDVVIIQPEAPLVKEEEVSSASTASKSSLDKFVIVDLKATWLSVEESKEEEPLETEIIEFSSILVDAATGNLLEPIFHTYIRPIRSSGLNRFSWNTATKQEDVEGDGAVILPQALQMHESWLLQQTNGGGGAAAAVVTWGNCLKMLHQECQRKGLEMPDYFRRWINLNKSFASRYGDRYWGRPVREALEATNELTWECHGEEPPNGRLSHARNKARLLAFLKDDGATLTVTELPPEAWTRSPMDAAATTSTTQLSKRGGPPAQESK